VSENSTKIIGNKLLNDFNHALVQVSQVFQMSDTDSYEMSEEQFASMFAAVGFFVDLTSEQHFYDELVHLCTAKTTGKLHMTIRNARAIVFGIYNIHQEWMGEQDKSEWEGYYHQRIQKYRMIKEKLTELIADKSDALKHSCQEKPLSLPHSQEELLTEEERSLYMESPTKFGVGNFKGRSLCFTAGDTHSLHLHFLQLYKNKFSRD
jgi:hypothetical protein